MVCFFIIFMVKQTINFQQKGNGNCVAFEQPVNSLIIGALLCLTPCYAYELILALRQVHILGIALQSHLSV